MAANVSPIPGTFFEWDDQSAILAPEVPSTTNSPLYAAVFTADKGPEGWQVLSGQEWFDNYAVNNVVDFNKHGQPLLQAAMSINAGARMLCKRVVADDAFLANLAILVEVVTTETQKTNDAGEKLYIDADGQETTEATDTEGNNNTPVMESASSIKYSYRSAQGCKTKEEVIAAINADTDKGDALPLFIVFDNGRGESKKRIRITPNYMLSKNYETYFMYDLDIIEGSTYFNTIHFALNPNLVSNSTNMSFQYRVNDESAQIEAYQYPENIRIFMDQAIAATGLPADEASGMDLMFGKNKKQKPLNGLTVDTDGGVDIAITTGQLLLNGDNGSFGKTPITAENYGPMLAKAFAGYTVDSGTKEPKILTYKDGCYDPIIYNVDRYKIDAIFDANYPPIVKRAAETLVTFREDCEFFRDLGTTCNTMDLIRMADYENLHNKFCTTYCTYYDVIDPFSKCQITVTMMYHMAQLAVAQFTDGVSLPMAGILHGFTITDIIEGTVGFTPTICPELNEKEDLVDLRINYATYIDNRLVVESIYTSQDKLTQLSFSNNVLLVQKIIKVIRSEVPAYRYSLIDGADLSKYKARVEEIIAPYKSMFKTLDMVYMEDHYYTENKIFYAGLNVRFRDFVQTEFFKITALGSNTTNE